MLITEKPATHLSYRSCSYSTTRILLFLIYFLNFHTFHDHTVSQLEFLNRIFCYSSFSDIFENLSIFNNGFILCFYRIRSNHIYSKKSTKEIVFRKPFDLYEEITTISFLLQFTKNISCFLILNSSRNTSPLNVISMKVTTYSFPNFLKQPRRIYVSIYPLIPFLCHLFICSVFEYKSSKGQKKLMVIRRFIKIYKQIKV